METVRALTDDEIATFRRDGAAHVSGLVSTSLARSLLEAADEQRKNPGEHSMSMTSDGKFWEERESYRRNEAFRSFVMESALAREAGRALKSSEIRLYFDHLFILEADTAKDDYYWHQDQPYWACEGSQICSFWLALTDCTVDSGALELVVGTDKELLLPEWLPETQGRQKDGTAVTPAYHRHRDRYRIVNWDIKAGDAILFNSRIMHSSRGNHSKTQRRVAYSTRWIGDDVVFISRKTYQDPVTVPQETPADGTPLARCTKFPLLWRRSS
jgi:ectoine hydroxylase-related dioxygenase (phytanoyl-CoA dioxygenase family)